MNSTTKQTIPIVILHRDEASFLRKMIDSIRQHTVLPHQLVIVDNKSTQPESIELLNELEASGAIIIKNPHNRWVLGFNTAFDHPSFNQDAPYFIFSDCDLLVPKQDKAGRCWLARLIELMDSYACAGKIGLSLDLSNLSNRPDLRHILTEEQRYASGKKIGCLTIAPVDTTIAIYRRNAFITDHFRFLPGHKSLIRPYLYSLRTPSDFSAIHLGWLDYGDPAKQVGDKIRCFAQFGGNIDRVTLSMARLSDRLYYRLASPVWKAIWGLVVSYLWARYIIRRFPRHLNEIQAEARAAHCRK